MVPRHAPARSPCTTVDGVRRRFPGQLWVKLPGTGDNLVALADAARAVGADAVVLAGRVMGMMPDVETLRPVLGTSAAYGGQWAVPITCRWLALTRRALGSDFPLIGSNGARSGLDVARFLLAGAAAVEMTSAVWLAGFDALSRARQELLGWLQQKDLTVSAVVGRAADELKSYGEQSEQAGRWRSLVPPESIA
jgi:dihydroorotate dehydrogenase (NAD+) catalytic subunit